MTYHDPRALLDRSNELLDERRDTENVELLRAGIEWFPNDPYIRLRAATLAAEASQQPTEAMEQLRRAVELAPEDPSVLTRAASHMFDLGGNEDAEQWTRCAGQLAPDDFALSGHLCYLTGRVFLLHDLEDQAERMFELGFEIDPGMPEHGVMLASFHELRGRPREALGVLDEALRHSPGDRGLQHARARILGDPDDGRAAAR